MTFATLALLSGCSRRADIGYEVTVTVNDHGVLRSRSANWRYSIRGGGFPNAYNTRFRGEAIPIDLGAKGTLYVLTVGREREKGWPVTSEPIIAYGSELFGEKARINRGEPTRGLDPLQQVQELRAMTGREANLQCGNLPGYASCPFMVRFRDESDPMSVEAVNPADLAATYGPGVSLLPIRVRLTANDVTVQGIARRLKWVSRPASISLDGKPIQSGWALTAMLQTRAFRNLQD